MPASLVARSVQSAYFDPDWGPALASTTLGLHPFTSVTDNHWTGIVSLATGQPLHTTDRARNDIYVLRGSVHDVGKRVEFQSGAFLRRNAHSELLAGTGGATLLVYRDRPPSTDADISLLSEHQVWADGSVPGMRVSVLSAVTDRVLLVSWEPGTRVRSHLHPAGEDLLVISGALSDVRGRHPAGSWMRFHPGSGHAPFATVDTLIVLRNGHLADPSGPTHVRGPDTAASSVLHPDESHLSGRQPCLFQRTHNRSPLRRVPCQHCPQPFS